MKTTIIFLGLILFLTACEKPIEPLQPPRPALVTIVGASSAHTIIESTIRRFRPIVLTAAAAILAMIPLTRSVFWPDGSGDYGRASGRNFVDSVVFTCTVRGLV